MGTLLQNVRTQFNTGRLALRYSLNWKLLLRLARGYGRVNLLRRDQLRFVELFVTLACNARCAFCSNNLFSSKRGTVTKAQYLRLIDECAALDVPVVGLLGGEPLLYRPLDELIARIDRHGMLSCVATNGYLLDEQRIRELARAGLKNIIISLLSPHAEAHDAAMGLKGCFERVLAARELCRRHGILYSWATVVTHQHFADGTFDAFVRLAESRQVPLSVNPLIPTGGARDQLDQMLHREDVEKLDRLASESTLVSTHLTNNYFGFGCPAGNAYLGVNATGEIFPCFFCPISLGSVRDTSLAEAWQKALRSPLFSRRHKMCFLGVSREFYHEFLLPVLQSGRVPLPLEQHPRYDPDRRCLPDLQHPGLAEAVGYRGHSACAADCCADSQQSSAEEPDPRRALERVTVG